MEHTRKSHVITFIDNLTALIVSAFLRVPAKTKAIVVTSYRTGGKEFRQMSVRRKSKVEKVLKCKRDRLYVHLLEFAGHAARQKDLL